MSNKELSNWILLDKLSWKELSRNHNAINDVIY
jgi:hypothetical protein